MKFHEHWKVKEIESDSHPSRKMQLTGPPHHAKQHRKCELLNSESDKSCVQTQLRNELKRNRNDVHSAYVRRKVSTLLLVLTCLAVKLELVVGALPLNYNSVNYYDNSTALDSENAPWLTLTNHIDEKRPTTSRPAVIYQNEFAVFIPGGIEVADIVAAKHGFTNTGKVSRQLLSIILDFFTFSYVTCTYHNFNGPRCDTKRLLLLLLLNR